MTRDDIKLLLDAYGKHINTQSNGYPPQSSIAYVGQGGGCYFGSKLPRIKNTPSALIELRDIIEKLCVLSVYHQRAMTSVLLRHLHFVRPGEIASMMRISPSDERRQYTLGLDFLVTAYAFV